MLIGLSFAKRDILPFVKKAEEYHPNRIWKATGICAVREVKAMVRFIFSSRRRWPIGSALLALGLLFCCEATFAADGNGDLPYDKAMPIFEKIRDKWSAVQSVQYDIESRDSPSKEFKVSANVTTNERDLLISRATFKIKEENYGWSTDTFVPATGAHEQVSDGSLYKGTLSQLCKDQKPLLLVSTGPKFRDLVAVTGNNPMMEAFSFLISDSWDGLDCPTLTIKSVASRDVWLEATKRITSITEESFDSHPCTKVVFGSNIVSHDVVYFTKDADSFPLCWQHFEGTYMRRKVVVREMIDAPLKDGKSITLPRVVERRDFFDPGDPSVLCSYNQTLSNVTVNRVIPDHEFVVDPALAVILENRDTGVRTELPK